MKVIIREARTPDCGRMSRMLRAEHMVALAKVGLETHRTLRSIYDRSYYRKALMIDGELVGLGGVDGNFMSPCGYVWLAVSREAHHYPLTLIREIRKCLDEITLTKRILVTTVLDGDEAALRLMAFLGFSAEAPGDGTGEGRPAYSAAARHRMVKYVKRNPDLWKPAGLSAVVSFLFEPEGAHVMG